MNQHTDTDRFNWLSNHMNFIGVVGTLPRWFNYKGGKPWYSSLRALVDDALDKEIENGEVG